MAHNSLISLENSRPQWPRQPMYSARFIEPTTTILSPSLPYKMGITITITSRRPPRHMPPCLDTTAMVYRTWPPWLPTFPSTRPSRLPTFTLLHPQALPVPWPLIPLPPTRTLLPPPPLGPPCPRPFTISFGRPPRIPHGSVLSLIKHQIVIIIC